MLASISLMLLFASLNVVASRGAIEISALASRARYALKFRLPTRSIRPSYTSNDSGRFSEPTINRRARAS